jgi:hypothetical protein
MSDHLTTADFERETEAALLPDDLRHKIIANLHREHDYWMDRLTTHPNTVLKDRVVAAKIAFNAAFNLKGYEALSDEDLQQTKDIFVALLNEQKAQEMADPSAV